MEKHFYHLFANGNDAKNFIISEYEFKTAFNRFAVCHHVTGVDVISFSIEDSHPHALIFGTHEECSRFKDLYVSLSKRHIVQQRGSLDGVFLHCEIDEINDDNYLMNAAAYTIIQATKDGKAVMPYDYEFGTGAMYFRSAKAIMPWMIGEEGTLLSPVSLSKMTEREREKICATKIRLPGDWLVCNGFILPENYVRKDIFESIFRTPNCFRVFLSSPKARDEAIQKRMSEVRGIMIDDLEARKIYEKTCMEMFGAKSARMLNVNQRTDLARRIRHNFKLSFRQLSALTRIPESELKKYI